MADTQINEVVVEDIRWSKTVYPKQTSPTQKDSMGGYQVLVALVQPGKGGKDAKRIVIQTDGKPVEGTLPTRQRRFIHLLVAQYFTQGSKKGNGYADTLALNLEDAQSWFKNVTDQGWYIEAHYGSNADNATPLFVSAADLLASAVTSLKIRNSTVERFPLPDEVKKSLAAEPEIEKVELSF